MHLATLLAPILLLATCANACMVAHFKWTHPLVGNKKLIHLNLVDNGINTCWLNNHNWDGQSQIWLQCRQGFFAWIRWDNGNDARHNDRYDMKPIVGYAHGGNDYRFAMDWRRETPGLQEDIYADARIWGC